MMLFRKCLWLFVIALLLCFVKVGYAKDVTLEWDPNTEPDLAGYEVYYKAGSSGEPYDGTGATEGDSPIDVGDVTTFTLHSLADDVTYFLVVKAYDTEGLYSDYSNEVATCSVAEPIVTGETPTNDTTPTWTWSSGGGEGSGTFRYKLDNDDLTSGATEISDPTPITYTPDPLPEGSHTLYVQERDTAGNWSSSGSFSIVIDTTSPGAPSVSGTTPTNDTTPTWSWSSGGGGHGTYRYKLDNSNLSSGATQTTSTSYTPGAALSEGSHTLYVQERDTAGNWSSSGSFSIVIDVTEPSVPGITTDGGNGPGNDYTSTDSSITLEGSCVGDTVAIYVNGSADGVTYTAGETSWTYTGTLESGDNTFTITAVDAAGNISDAGSITITTTNFKPDTPVLSSPTDGETGVSLTPELQTDAFSDPDTGDTHAQSQWQMSTDGDFSSLLLDITSSSHLTSLSVPQFILDDGATYYWRVRFYDNSLAASDWSESYVFTTLATSNDTNLNGIPDDQEVDSTVDLDGNGTPDINQSDIACVNTVVGDGMIGVSFHDSTTVSSIESIESIDPDTISDTNNSPETIPFGLITFKLTVANPGDTAVVTVYLSEPAPAGATWYIYDPINGWQDYSAHATFSEDGMSVTLELIDGDYGDADGTANGIIVVGTSGLGFAPASDGGGNGDGSSGDGGDGGTPVAPSGDGGGGAGGCFIATAAYGSQVEPHVKVLREFRDRFLLTNTLGKAFVDLYYTYSPPAEEFIASHDPLRLMVRWSLLPLVGGTWIALHSGPGGALMLAVPMLYLMSVGIRVSLRQRRLRRQV